MIRKLSQYTKESRFMMKVLWFIMLWSAAIVFLLSQSSNAKSLRRSPVAKVSDDSWMKKSLQHADGMAVERLKRSPQGDDGMITTTPPNSNDSNKNFIEKMFDFMFGWIGGIFDFIF
ncbi:uncharacterized protein LOC129975985 [Argiope bruennichi]|uniref:uncharacterized protein LOC129975985 n=1 Tax=Argiope bruennichi TaxID=94029 RepID=UPI002493D7A5|nr:uncharacterized protein LOC129975985 [Argiope bruennichi]